MGDSCEALGCPGSLRRPEQVFLRNSQSGVGRGAAGLIDSISRK